MPPIPLKEAAGLLGCSLSTMYNRILRKALVGWQDATGHWWVELSPDDTAVPPQVRWLRKWQPLCQYLEQLAAEQQTVLLSFTEIEALIGLSLRPTARTTSYWRRGYMANRNWRQSGWQARIERPATVVFSRHPRDA